MSAAGVSIDPQKTEAIVRWEQLKTVMEVRSFLGLAGYYRRFVQGFSKIALPLTSLTKKNTKFEWNEKCEQSFHELNRRLVTAPILVLPESGKEFEVYCDASHQGLGCVLMQVGGVIVSPIPDLVRRQVKKRLRVGCFVRKVGRDVWEQKWLSIGHALVALYVGERSLAWT